MNTTSHTFLDNDGNYHDMQISPHGRSEIVDSQFTHIFSVDEERKVQRRSIPRPIETHLHQHPPTREEYNRLYESHDNLRRDFVQLAEVFHRVLQLTSFAHEQPIVSDIIRRNLPATNEESGI